VVTRCTVIEHGAYVDCGTVVENSTVLPSAYVGAGLDLAHSVVGMGRIANLRRNTTVEIPDRNLIAHFPMRGARRLLRRMTEFLSALSAKLGRVPKPETPAPPALEPAPPVPDVLNVTPETPAGDNKDAEMAGVRTDGDQ